MTITIRIHGDEADEELRSLYRWFLNEPMIRQDAGLKLVAKEPKSGEMGTALDVISLVTTGTIGLPGMIEVLRAWRSTRRRKPEIMIERGDLKATFIDTDPEAIIQILESTRRKNDTS